MTLEEKILAYVKSCGLCNFSTIAEDIKVDRKTVHKVIKNGLKNKKIMVEYTVGKYTKYVEYVNKGDFTIKEITSVDTGFWGEYIIKGVCYDVIDKDEGYCAVDRPFELKLSKKSFDMINEVIKSEVPFF